MALGLDWLPADTDLVMHVPGNEPMAPVFLFQLASLPPCAQPLFRHVEDIYSLMRGRDDGPLRVVVGDFTRDAVERCVGDYLQAQGLTAAVTREGELTHVIGDGVDEWLGWAGRRVLWGDRARIDDTLHPPARVAPGSAFAALLPRLAGHDFAMVTTVVQRRIYGADARAAVTVLDGERLELRLLFDSPDEARAAVDGVAAATQVTPDLEGNELVVRRSAPAGALP
jgi:hypothetical protein